MEYFVIFLLGSSIFYFVGGIPRLAAGLRELGRAMALERLARLPALRASEVREGPVRVTGRVAVAGKELTSPDSMRGCVAYEEHVGWVGIEVSATAFDLTDGTAPVRVEAQRPVLLVRQERGLMGERMRLLRAGDRVTVYGVAVRVPDVVGPLSDYRRGSERIVVRAAPGQPLYVVRDRIAGLENLALGAAGVASGLVLLAFLIFMWA
ncbi:hypothetical protein [Polyangium aurulentum]|uniref:hypothetical protein n=1 Tax=Polyangium aurulentum TaxID=2567896 RepID=UPI0010AECF70|nr:hypothetical protein [Polyangium aurulentum]UQA57219.1 hypothetical protein E8A73_038930 [Polyangium aurulentum]